MKGAGQKITGAIKRVTRLGSSRSWGESSSRYSSEPTPTPTMMDYEQEEQYEDVQAEPQAEDMEIDENDAPYLDFRDDHERQAYAMIKN